MITDNCIGCATTMGIISVNEQKQQAGTTSRSKWACFFQRYKPQASRPSHCTNRTPWPLASDCFGGADAGILLSRHPTQRQNSSTAPPKQPLDDHGVLVLQWEGRDASRWLYLENSRVQLLIVVLLLVVVVGR
ncbi:uncharacterized protein A4U43_UnF530 [Asparagus officinalis]|uniref:Uncharacterized protein n=1 Tax=Asparagus officinalis TaxID=4686 RepID=A0A1R3L7T2_ASPOF|nr:uncharacterized protein A4U43_UnF530 [Asparagus officinalis]